MSQQIALYVFGALWTVLVGVLGFAATRIFNKLDEIAKKFEAIGENFGRIYKDINKADQQIWERLHEMDKEITEIKAKCESTCRR